MTGPTVRNQQVRRLTPVDADDIRRLVDLRGLTPSVLARELAAGEDYVWVGLGAPAGGFRAVHRGLRWGRHLLLKGVFVDAAWRGSGAALEVAFALRDLARGFGYAGIVAWVEPHEREAGLARLLRLRQGGPLVHRFEIPIACNAFGESAGAPANSGVIMLDLAGRARPMVDDLLLGVTGDKRQPVGLRWVVDRSRLVLTGLPCHSVADLPELVSTMKPLVHAHGVTALEIPVPAADVLAALSLAGMKARRLSRTPVRIGRLDFAGMPAAMESSASDTDHVRHGSR